MSGIKSAVCSRGHRLSGKNLYRRRDGGRQCRACALKRIRDKRAAAKEARA